MAKREKIPAHKVVMTEGKRNIIQQLLQEYDIETAKDIQDALKDLLVEPLKRWCKQKWITSEDLVSDVTDKILSKIEDWQNRPLDGVYPFLYIDAIHYSVSYNGVIRQLLDQPFLKQISKVYSNQVHNILNCVPDKDWRVFLTPFDNPPPSPIQ